MDKTVLVENILVDGERVIKALEREKYYVAAALWLYDKTEDEWKLTICLDNFYKVGPLQAYKTIDNILSNNDLTIDLKDIRVVGYKDKLISAILQEEKQDIFSERKIKRSVINDVYIEEAYIYKV